MNQDDEQDDQDLTIPDNNVEDIAPQPSYSIMMLSQTWGDIKELQQGLNILNINVTRDFERVHQRIDHQQQKFDDFDNSFK